jgi:hypothetical protein
MYRLYGIPRGTPAELDHLVPIGLGGSNAIINLWPEAGRVPNPKDLVENRLRAAVCAGTVTLAAAQQAIAADWMTAIQRLGLRVPGQAARVRAGSPGAARPTISPMT